MASGMDEGADVGRSSSAMSRSRSIGNLRFSAAKADGPHNNTFGGPGSSQ